MFTKIFFPEKKYLMTKVGYVQLREILPMKVLKENEESDILYLLKEALLVKGSRNSFPYIPCLRKPFSGGTDYMAPSIGDARN